MDSRQWALSLLVALFSLLALVSAEEAAVEPAEDSSSDIDKRGGGRAFAGPFGAFYPSSKRISDSFYSFYDKRGGGRAYLPAAFEKRGGGRAYLPASFEKRGGGRAYAFNDKRGGGRAYFPIAKRGGGRAFVGDWAAYPRMERRAGGRAFAGDWSNYAGRY